MLTEARFYEPMQNYKVRCGLCPHFCVISNNEKGLCLIRKNINGKLVATCYAEVSSVAVDPIEKKPLYHFHPSSHILSIGFNGCNMRCDFCQNWHISMSETKREKVSSSFLLEKAKESNSIGVAYTYNEPLTNYEFVYDCAVEFKRHGLKNVVVTNGFINTEPLRAILPLLDAVNIDLKGFNGAFYQNIGGVLEIIKQNIRICFDSGICTEVTNLVIPERNDDALIFEEMCQWLSSVSCDIPLHLSAYFPAFNSNNKPCSADTLLKLAEIAKKYLNYVYIGNIKGIENNSLCPNCKAPIVKRGAYDVKYLQNKTRCIGCDKPLYFFF